MSADSRSSDFRSSVLKAIEDDWPIHTKQLVSALGLEVNNSNVKRVSYHVQQLEKEGKVRTKRIGLALTARADNYNIFIFHDIQLFFIILY